jgi:hypothetical protein
MALTAKERDRRVAEADEAYLEAAKPAHAEFNNTRDKAAQEFAAARDSQKAQSVYDAEIETAKSRLRAVTDAANEERRVAMFEAWEEFHAEK